MSNKIEDYLDYILNGEYETFVKYFENGSREYVLRFNALNIDIVYSVTIIDMEIMGDLYPELGSFSMLQISFNVLRDKIQEQRHIDIIKILYNKFSYKIIDNNSYF